MSIFNNPQKLITNKFTTFFLLKSAHAKFKHIRLIQNYSKQTFQGDKRRFPTKTGVPENPTSYTFLNKDSQKHHYFGATLIFNPTI